MRVPIKHNFVKSERSLLAQLAGLHFGSEGWVVGCRRWCMERDEWPRGMRRIHCVCLFGHFFPTLAVGLLDFKVDVVLARLEADFRDQPPSIPAVPKHQVSLQCPTAEYPCSAQPQSILTLPNCKVSLQCSTTKYPCSAQLLSIPAVPNH